jgi:hypothetical protein
MAAEADALENVDLTFDSSDGRRPGSGSSWKGLGNVVRVVLEVGAGGGAAGAEGEMTEVVGAGRALTALGVLSDGRALAIDAARVAPTLSATLTCSDEVMVRQAE